MPRHNKNNEQKKPSQSNGAFSWKLDNNQKQPSTAKPSSTVMVSYNDNLSEVCADNMLASANNMLQECAQQWKERETQPSCRVFQHVYQNK